MKPLRKLYDWTLHWADTPYGPIALFIMAFAESSFFPIPPDVLLIALCLGAVRRSFWFALQCSIASVLGGVFGYGIGHFLWYTPGGDYSVIARLFFRVPGFTVPTFEHVQGLYNSGQNAFWIVWTAGFTPIPYKVFTIASGVFKMNLWSFVLASITSRTLRFFLVAGMIYLFGKHIKVFIDKYFNLLTTVFTVLLIGFFVVLKYVPIGKHETEPVPTNAVVQSVTLLTNAVEVTK